MAVYKSLASIALRFIAARVSIFITPNSYVIVNCVSLTALPFQLLAGFMSRLYGGFFMGGSFFMHKRPDFDADGFHDADL